MSWTNRVVWQEGMFLRAQHFQQQDRHLQSVIRGRTSSLRSHAWGVAALEIDRNLLGTGRFAVAHASGVFEDGTPFSTPGEAELPAALELSDRTRNELVFLAVPIYQDGAIEVAQPGLPEARYAVRPFEAYDTHSGSPQPAEVQVGRLQLRYLLESSDRKGYLYIALARVVEVSADGKVTLDPDWIPPALSCSTVRPLSGLLAELVGMLNQRGETLAGRLADPGPGAAVRGVADIADFLLLQTVNGWQKLLSHWGDSGEVHPADLYAALVQLAGELATFSVESKRRPNAYPAYRHNDLQRSFAPVVVDLRRYIADMGDPNAIPFPLEDRQGVLVGWIQAERALLRRDAATFVLVVRAEMKTEELRWRFPAQIKIGAVEHIKQLARAALPGIDVGPLPVAPRQLPFYPGASYFELDRSSPHWQQMQSSAGFGIVLAGDIPGLIIELWAIRA